MALHFYLRDVLRQTFQTLWAHKLRTFLKMFGIAWGIISITLMAHAVAPLARRTPASRAAPHRQ